MKIHHQQTANLFDSDQNTDLIFGGNHKYHQIGTASIQYEMTVERDVGIANRVLLDGDVLRLVITARVYCFKEARLSTTGGSNIENKKY